MNKHIIISPSHLDKKMLDYAVSLGIRDLYCKYREVSEELIKGFNVYVEKEDGEVELLGREDTRRIVKIRVEEANDIEKVLDTARAGADMILVDTPSWKIIPLENLIAELQRTETRLYAYSSSLEEVETLLGVLEKGVDGVVVRVESIEDVEKVVEVFKTIKEIKLVDAEVIDVKSIGMGDRVCVDTASILNIGEGLLVGNTAQFFFLVHNENIGSIFTSPRPFRVNAGAVHCYVMMPDGSTKYLSEISSGMKILVASSNGQARAVTVGRVKIEKRPMKLVRARFKEIEGSIILQDAETIRLVKSSGSLISITDLNPGEKIVVYISELKARHFGKAVEEFIIER